ncbi:MAG: anti-sigma factor family protein, partial [Candidatus Thorarchaeota archaeon]
MLRCEDVRRQLQAFLDNELDESQSHEISDHLKACRNCADALRRLPTLSKILQNWQAPEPSPLLYNKLKARMNTHDSRRGGLLAGPLVRKVALHLAEVAAVVVLTLFLSRWLGSPPQQAHDDSATLNFYLREHQDMAAQVASFDPSPPPAHFDVPQHDILYYEFLGDPYELGRPGVIVRGPLSVPQPGLPPAPAIANGHALTLSEARKAARFDLVSPPRLHPGYMLDQIRRIEDRDALHLLYTNGIDTVSLFEQPL